MSAADGLGRYRERRAPKRSGEPAAGSRHSPHFVIQHHLARADHFDFRLEVDGVLASWAVPKGPSTDPRERRMARRTEDHPLDYETFEGVLPTGEYRAGRVIVWDRGTYRNLTEHRGEQLSMADGLERGHVSFWLYCQKLYGGYALTRIRVGGDETWLLVKQAGEGADARRRPVHTQPESVISGRTLDSLAEGSAERRRDR